MTAHPSDSKTKHGGTEDRPAPVPGCQSLRRILDHRRHIKCSPVSHRSRLVHSARVEDEAVEKVAAIVLQNIPKVREENECIQ